MSDQVNADTSQATQTTTSAPEPTLDDVYREAGITDSATQQQTTQSQDSQQQTQQTTVAPIDVPDPFTETERFKATIAQQHQGMQVTQQAVQAIAQFISAQRAQEIQKVVRKDIDDAVKTVNEVVGHSSPKVIEAMLNVKATEDAKFKALWENRYKNPEGWKKALGVVSREFQKEFDVKADAGLVEAQRARRVAQGQMATTVQSKPDDSWDGLSQDEFQQRWQSMTES